MKFNVQLKIVLCILSLLSIVFLVPSEVYAAADGDVTSTVEINDYTANGPELSDDDLFGSSIANIGDLNGDGVNDIAVGAYYDDEGGPNRGAVHIMFMNTNGSVDSTVVINDSTANGPTLTDHDYFGRSVASIGDLNGDGVNDIAIAAFVDQSKDPQHYIDRYFNESKYKQWFDKNYPQYTSIYEAVGLEEPVKENIVEIKTGKYLSRR